MSNSEINADLKVTSTNDLKALIDKVNAVIEEREGKTSEGDIEHLKSVMSHIAMEVDGPAVAHEDMDHHLPMISLEHLELYENFLHRSAIPAELKEQYDTLLNKVTAALKNHPLAGAPRSGDKAGNEYGSAEILKVPLGRRRQTCVMLYLNLLTGPMLIIFTCIMFLLYFPYSPYLAALYIAWVTYDNWTRGFPSPNRVSQKWRRHFIYEMFRDYFPIRLIKADRTAVYDPTKNFLFGYHPHGVQSAGAFACGTGTCGFDELFPGLKPHIQTLGINFRIPFYRETVIGLGAGDASKQTLMNTLTPKAPGNSVVLVTGGALESMYSTPYHSKVVLQSRAGFVKVALQTGASLVPVWGFGENNLYENLAADSPRILRIQRKIQKMISFAPLLVSGRGMFTYSGGLLPRRRPISVVIGAPIAVGPPDPNPTSERINEVHTQYKNALLALFTKYRDVYDPKAQDIEFI